MESIDVNYGALRRYDTARPPLRQRLLFTAVLRALCGLSMAGQDYRIEKINMEGLEPPYLLLSNHMHFVDFKLCSIATWPHRVNNIATIDGYYRRPFIMEWLGCLCKRKFTTDMTLLRSVKKVLHEYGDILCMYPEARYSPAGTTAILPDSLGKLAKKQGVPVVVLLHHGNYLHTPFWNYRKPRKVPLYTTMTQVLTAGDVAEKSAAEIGDVIRQAMDYDEYRWQREKGIRITEPFRAEGLHKVLYQCPHCLAESKMESHGAVLRCAACGKEWELDELGGRGRRSSPIPRTGSSGSGVRSEPSWRRGLTASRTRWRSSPCPTPGGSRSWEQPGSPTTWSGASWWRGSTTGGPTVSTARPWGCTGSMWNTTTATSGRRTAWTSPPTTTACIAIPKSRTW